jgi:hypothetical protein
MYTILIETAKRRDGAKGRLTTRVRESFVGIVTAVVVTVTQLVSRDAA